MVYKCSTCGLVFGPSTTYKEYVDHVTGHGLLSGTIRPMED